MTEEEEDEELMLNANENEEEIITRFDTSPWCKYLFLLQLFLLLKLYFPSQT
jgi:hypothetical protein